MMRICKNVVISTIILAGLLTACNTTETPIDSEAQTKALSNTETHDVYNPYPSGATIPVNLCPINIAYPNRATITITLTDSTGKIITRCKQYFSKTFKPSEKKWRKWLQQAYKGSITISHDNITHTYYIAEAIDPYISYRKTLYSNDHQNMYIEERDITNFNNRKLIISSTKEDTTHTCINCHSPKNNNGDYSLIHVRRGSLRQKGNYAGTYLIKNGKVTRLVPQWDTLKTFNKLVYYDFHPTKEKIVFSTNHGISSEKFSKNNAWDYFMVDTLGIIVLYDINTNTITTGKSVSDANNYEYAAPVWNSNGTEIYFLRGPKLNRQKPWDYLFDLYKAPFDSLTNTFGEAEIIFPFSQCGISATQPRQIPETNKIIITVHKSTGSSPLWADGDFYILDLDSTQNIPFEIGTSALTRKTHALTPNKYAKISEVKSTNTLDGEMWHNFSSNGRWMIFSSSRLVGERNYPHIVYMDKNGKFGKPLAMPQKDPLFFTRNAWSYVIPNASKAPASFENKKAAELYLEVR